MKITVTIDIDTPAYTDVGQAISAIIASLDFSIPVPISKANAVDQLIGMSQMNRSPVAQRKIRKRWLDLLNKKGSHIFQNGYKYFEKTDNLSAIPISDYFFEVILKKDYSVCEVIDDMTEYEIQQSIPKRINPVYEDENSKEYIRNPDGSIHYFGKLEGVLVFPPNTDFLILNRWNRRLAGQAVGHSKKVASSARHAWPERIELDQLDRIISGLPASITSALPAPKPVHKA